MKILFVYLFQALLQLIYLPLKAFCKVQDQFNIIPLALQLLVHCRSNFRVRTCHLGNGIIVIRIHKIVLRSLFLLRTYTHYHTIF